MTGSVVTLDDVHGFLQIPSGDTSRDELLQTYIDAATHYVNFVAGQIIPTEFTDEVHSGGNSQIVLYNAPIVSVTTITEYWGITPYTLTLAERGGDLTTYGYSIDNADQGLISRVWSGVVGPFVDGVNNIVVTYTAGYSPIPTDITLAVLTDIQGLFNQGQNGGRPDFNGGDNEGAWTVAPINAFPRLANVLTTSRRVQAIA